jgi:ABC-type branched-subunit amino acid transport system substrate-binding protein
MSVKVARLAVAAMLAVALSACGNDAKPAGSSDSLPDIKLGAWLPLSGAQAAYGVPQKAGAEAYFKALNAAGGIKGRKIQWIVKDNAYDPQQTVQVARQLIDQEKVMAIVAAQGTAQSQAAFPYVLDQSKVPIINPYGGLAAWFTPPKPLLFGAQVLYEDQAAALGAWAVQDGKKKILVVHSDPKTFVAVAAQVGPAAKKIDPSVTVNTLAVKFNTTNYAPVVQDIKKRYADADAIVILLAAPEAAAYLKEAKLQGMTVQNYGWAPTASEDITKIAGDAANGLLAVSQVRVPSDNNPQIQAYRDAMAKYAPDQQVGFISLIQYAQAMVFGEILKTISGEITADSIVKAFESASKVVTDILPPMSYSTTQHLGTRDVQRVKVDGGKFVSVGDFYTPPPLSAA